MRVKTKRSHEMIVNQSVQSCATRSLGPNCVLAGYIFQLASVLVAFLLVLESVNRFAKHSCTGERINFYNGCLNSREVSWKQN